MADTDLTGRTIKAAPWMGQFEVLNLTLPDDGIVYRVSQLNGRVNDNARPANLKIVTSIGANTKPQSLVGLRPQILVRDNLGVEKQFGDDYTYTNSEAGLLNIKVPGQVYQVPGDVQNALFRLVNDQGTVISSVPITFHVDPDDSQLSLPESTTYLETVEAIKQAAIEKLDSISSDTSAANAALATLEQAVAAETLLIKNGHVGLLEGDQTWDGKNAFKNPVTLLADLITSNGDSLNALMGVAKNVGQDSGSMPVSLTDGFVQWDIPTAFHKIDLGNIWMITFMGAVKLNHGFDANTSITLCNAPDGIPGWNGGVILDHVTSYNTAAVTYMVPSTANRAVRIINANVLSTGAILDIGFMYFASK